jgi:hypothetical protein
MFPAGAGELPDDVVEDEHAPTVSSAAPTMSWVGTDFMADLS